jgi:penicillin-binding protein 1A
MTEARRIQKRKERAKSNKNIFKSVVLVGIAVLLVAGFFGAGAVKSIIQAAPPLDVGKIEELSQTTFFYYQNGEPITEYFGFENRVWATLDEIPIKLQQAFISIEDKRFYDHKGMDFIRHVRIALRCLDHVDTFHIFLPQPSGVHHKSVHALTQDILAVNKVALVFSA